MKNKNGVSLILASWREDLYEVIKKVDSTERCKGSSLLDCLNKRLVTVKEDLRLYIKHQIILDTFEDILSVNITNWLATNKESKLFGKKITVLIEKKSYWSYLVADFAKSKNVSYLVFHGINLKKNKLIHFIYHFIKLFLDIIISFVSCKKVENLKNEVKIGIPFYCFQNFTNYFDSRNYYLFWFYKSGILPEDILIYLPRSEARINDEEISNIKKAKFNIVSCSNRIMKKSSGDIPKHRCSLRTIPLLFHYLKQIIKMYICAKGKFKKEQWKILSLLFVQLPYWEDFFQRNNIKIKFRFHDMFSFREIAAKLSDVLTLSYHYSNHSDTTILHQDICDIFFIWGKKYENCLSREYSTVKHLIHTGYSFDYTFDNLRKRATSIRDNFKLNNATYLIGILDENLGSYFNKPQMNCYKAILKYAVEQPDIGIIIKPKKANTVKYLKSSVEAIGLIDILEKQSRIKFLNCEKYPVEAGLASDIVIGVFPDSTAGLECVLAGVPMVIYDCMHFGKTHQYYAWGYNRVIFDDIKQLFKMLDGNKTGSYISPGFADWSPILDDIDLFRDGKANQRIGTYIKTFLLKLDSGLTKDDAIRATNAVYANEFGMDKVISLR